MECYAEWKTNLAKGSNETGKYLWSNKIKKSSWENKIVIPSEMPKNTKEGWRMGLETTPR